LSKIGKEKRKSRLLRICGLQQDGGDAVAGPAGPTALLSEIAGRNSAVKKRAAAERGAGDIIAGFLPTGRNKKAPTGGAGTCGSRGVGA
jgi:hypothetical protein